MTVIIRSDISASPSPLENFPAGRDRYQLTSRLFSTRSTRVKFVISILLFPALWKALNFFFSFPREVRSCSSERAAAARDCYTKAKGAPELRRRVHDTLNLPNVSADKNARIPRVAPALSRPRIVPPPTGFARRPTSGN